MKTLGGVDASQSANWFTLEGRAADQFAALDRIAVLARLGQFRLLGRRIRRAPGEGTDAGAEVRAVAQRVEVHAEHGAGRERRAGDPLLRNRGGAGHLDAPLDVLAVGALLQ